MVVLVIGGSGSGKSAYAEERAVALFARQEMKESAISLSVEQEPEESAVSLSVEQEPKESAGFIQMDVSEASGADHRLVYLATMEVRDEESRRRVKRHRQMRKEKQFVTVECPTHLEEVAAGPGDTFLLECISNLVANEMYAPGGRKTQTAEVILTGIRRLAETANHLVLVGNHVFSDGIEYDASTTEYLRQMAQIQQEAAALADEVIEVVCGIPLVIKTALAKSNTQTCFREQDGTGMPVAVNTGREP